MTGVGIVAVLLLTTAPPGAVEVQPGWATASGLRVANLVAAPEQPSELEVQREQLLGAQRKLKIATAGSLLLTGTLGTILALDRDTLLWDGRCSVPDGRPLLGDYGCNELSVVHGISAVLSLLLYTSTTAVSLSVPGEPAVVPTGRPGVDGAFYRAVSWVHLVGIILQPILGFLGHYPGLIGLDRNGSESFSRTMRTIHLGVGYVTIAAFTTSLALEF